MTKEVTFPPMGQPYTHWLIPVEKWKEHNQMLTSLIKELDKIRPDLVHEIRMDVCTMTAFSGLHRVHVAMEEVA